MSFSQGSQFPETTNLLSTRSTDLVSGTEDPTRDRSGFEKRDIWTSKLPTHLPSGHRRESSLVTKEGRVESNPTPLLYPDFTLGVETGKDRRRGGETRSQRVDLFTPIRLNWKGGVSVYTIYFHGMGTILVLLLSSILRGTSSRVTREGLVGEGKKGGPYV